MSYFTILIGKIIAKAGLKLAEEKIAYNVAILGPSMVGKTTLDEYLTTPGPVEPIPESDRTRFIGPVTRKIVSWEGDGDQVTRRTVRTCDVPGQRDWHSAWIDVLLSQKAEIVVFMVDHRHLTSQSMDCQFSLSFIQTCLTERVYPGSNRRHRKMIEGGWFQRRKREKRKKVCECGCTRFTNDNETGRLLCSSCGEIVAGEELVGYVPKLFVLMANMVDQWMGLAHPLDHAMLESGQLFEPVYCYNCKGPHMSSGGYVDLSCPCGPKWKNYHPIFQPFLPFLERLRSCGIPTMLWACSAKTGYKVGEGFIRMISRLG